MLTSYIDKLIEGQETIISRDVCSRFDALTFLKAEYQWRNLPPIQLYKFSEDPSKWPKNGERLHNILDSKAKEILHSIGQSYIFYSTVLECQKLDY